MSDKQDRLNLLSKVLDLHKVDLSLMPKTLERYSNVLLDLNKQGEDMEAIKKGIFNEEGTNGMIIEGDIPVYSWCEHHILPWFGTVDIGYIAEGRVLGLSKFTRLVRYYSVGMTLQERVASDIADFLVDYVSSSCMVVVRAMHTCKIVRGISNPMSRTTTQEVRGLFKKDVGPRIEFFDALKGAK